MCQGVGYWAVCPLYRKTQIRHKNFSFSPAKQDTGGDRVKLKQTQHLEVAKSWCVAWRQVGCAVALPRSFYCGLGKGGWALVMKGFTPGSGHSGTQTKEAWTGDLHLPVSTPCDQ